MSSEALERADEMIAALLAEVARLEQAHAKMEASYEVDIAALERAEAALAVARERAEQAERALVAHHDIATLSEDVLREYDYRKCPVCARAAAVDEPAADEPAPQCPHCGNFDGRVAPYLHELTDVPGPGEPHLCGSCGKPFLVAAADEPSTSPTDYGPHDHFWRDDAAADEPGETPCR